MKVARIYYFILLSGIWSISVSALSKETIEYAISKYEEIISNKYCLFYPAKQPKNLVIAFGGAVPKRYYFLSWFWREDEAWQDTAYLFLRDDDLGWYLGIGNESFIESYKTIINEFMSRCNVTSEQVITLGSSMGGYGALYYATIMKLKGAIIINPQINYMSARSFGVHLPGKNWEDLDKVLENVDYIPMISVTFGSYFRDVNAAQALIDVLKRKKATFVVHSTGYPTHEWTWHKLTKQFVDREIEYIANHIYL